MGTHGPNQGQSVLQAGGEGCGENSLAVDCRHDKERELCSALRTCRRHHLRMHASE
jgi:hypothetical protein